MDEDIPITILSFRDKIVRVELLDHVEPEKTDGTRVTDVVSVCGLSCRNFAETRLI